MIPVSIIVPIYNMETFLQRCLDSILAQTFRDYECLLIDDGSIDDSPAICDEYTKQDSRFITFHKPNGGLSDARNYGLAHAQGEYTIFFDPDDWVDETCLEEMYEKAMDSDSDMVMCDLYYNDKYRQTYCKQEPTSLSHDDVLKDLITGKVFGFTVTKLIRNCLYKKYNIQFPVGMYGCEDQYTMCELLKNNIKISYLPRAYYHYEFYSYSSASRHYEQSTLDLDIKVRNMFVQLFQDKEMQQLAYQYKTVYMVSRAFKYGQGVFTSSSFKCCFSPYKDLVMKGTDNCLDRFFLSLAFAGFYNSSRYLWGIGFKSKQLFKKTIHLFSKKI